MKKLPITIIIPTLNRAASLKRTINVISEVSECLPEEVLVIDQSKDVNARNDIEAFCRSITGTTVRYLFLPKPSSTLARNVGIRNATNNLLVFMDDDVDVNNDTLENIHKLIVEENAVMVGAIDETLPRSGGGIGYLFAMKSYKNRNIGSVTCALLGRYPEKIEGVVNTMWAMGFCFALRKDYLEKWKLEFDEKLTGYAYAEDLDLTYRYFLKAQNEGLRCCISDSVKVKHLESKEYRIPNKRNIFKYVINRDYLAYKYNSPISTHLAIMWSNVGLALSRIRNKEPLGDIIEAQVRCIKLKKYLKKGLIQESFFEESIDYKKLKGDCNEK